MNKNKLIKDLTLWDNNNVIIFDSKTGEYREIITVSRGMGKGVVIKI